MVADKGVESAIVLVGQILLADNFKCHIEIAHTLLEPLGASLMTTFPQVAVYLVLMYCLLQPRHKKTRDEFCFRPKFTFQYLVYVYGFFHK